MFEAIPVKMDLINENVVFERDSLFILLHPGIFHNNAISLFILYFTSLKMKSCYFCYFISTETKPH